ncbi:family 43 glycosylhydrolase [Nocardioides sp. TF02-7]|uniref:family 43 glycosylhydrolase n=1 Tax=Nocardioides sp. TF02-7 TaxID=2917724 RepID=UPI001F05351B|nr:family 43 glycosylhydrolase [Nocardioides sp. TF02-7]UMG94553.1 family 43 glycosylhydrolase [Nocardioides sp. TF02-7]
MGTWRLLGCVVVLAAVVALVAPVRAETVDRAAPYPRPVFAADRTGDPSVARTASGRVLVATGPLVRRARWEPGRGWRWTRPALRRLPRWARAGEVWAADIARVGRRWVLYFAAPVRGLGEGRRCIGVATAPTAYAAFRPVDRRPLVCHAGARTPRAADTVPGTRGLPRRGVIDPSLFVDRGGRRHLLYKTDGIPSSIRLLPLGRSGLAPAPGAVSTELFRYDGVTENPVVLRRGDTYHLLTSEEDWSRCSYRTMVRTSTTLTDWSAARPVPLLTRRSTRGLCGPGGADVLVEGGRTLMFFHGWVRRRTTVPPRPPFWLGHRGPAAHRALYAARLAFPDGRPAIARFLGR